MASFVGSATARAESAPSFASERDLPALVERWSHPGRYGSMLLTDRGILYADQTGVRLLDATTGKPRWSAAIANDSCFDCALALVDGRVAFASQSKLYLLAADSGRLLATVELPGNVKALHAAPLVLLLATDGGDALASVDLEQGTVRAQQSLPREAYDLAVEDGVALVIVYPEGDDLPNVIEGYDAASLRLLWSEAHKAFPQFEHVEGRLYLHGVCDCDVVGGREEYLPIDPRTGALGSPLPSREAAAIYDTEMPWELQQAPAPGERSSEDGPATLRRNDLATGKPRWSVELPGDPHANVRAGDTLYVQVSTSAGRGTLASIAWDSGRLRELAFGLPPETRELAVAADLLVVRATDGLHAFALGARDQPESRTVPLEQQVARTLLSTNGDEPIGDAVKRRVAELELLGAPACAPMAALLPKLGPSSIAAAAAFAENHDCRGLAGGLAALLVPPFDMPEFGWPEWKPPLAILHALANVGGPAEVPAVVGALRASTAGSELRVAAFTALASIGGDAAVAALHDALAEPSPARVAFAPEDPLEFLTFVGQPLPDEKTPSDGDAEATQRFWERHRLQSLGANAAAAADGDGGRWVAYHSTYAGGQADLWLAHLGADGRLLSRPLLTGLQVPFGPPGFDLQAQRDALVVRSAGLQPQQVRLSELARDSDGDGLTDVEERRLRLDPHQADSDGDGLGDSEDPAPNARLSQPASEDQRLQLALFEQLFRVHGEGARPGTLVVVGDDALEWRGRGSLTLTLSAEEAIELQKEATVDGIAYLTMKPIAPDQADGCSPRTADERAFGVDFYIGGLNAVGYCALMRRLGERWWLARLDMTWIS